MPNETLTNLNDLSVYGIVFYLELTFLFNLYGHNTKAVGSIINVVEQYDIWQLILYIIDPNIGLLSNNQNSKSIVIAYVSYVVTTTKYNTHIFTFYHALLHLQRHKTLFPLH